MARFRFSMQNLLNIKYKVEDQYQMEYGKAIQSRDSQIKKVAEIRELIQNTNHRFFEKQSGSFQVKDLKMVQDKLTFLRERERDARSELKKREELVVLWRERLASAMQDRKTYEILRDKAYERYLEEEKQQEMKRMDEQSSFKFSKNKGAK